MELNSLFQIIIFGLAVWKVHDLCFHSLSLKDYEELTKRLNRFYAEHTYKLMKQNIEYKEAPQEIYNWLDDSFIEWQEEQLKNND